MLSFNLDILITALRTFLPFDMSQKTHFALAALPT